MPFTLDVQQTVQLDSVDALISALSQTGDEVIQFDQELDAGLADEVVHIGVDDTSKVKALVLANIGEAAITSIKLDMGVIVQKLDVDAMIVILGTTACAAFLDAWSAATTMTDLKVTTPAGPTKAYLKVIVLADVV